MGSLAPGKDSHGLGLGIERSDHKKHVETLAIFFRCTPSLSSLVITLATLTSFINKQPHCDILGIYY
jgi:hypothetical protein